MSKRISNFFNLRALLPPPPPHRRMQMQTRTGMGTDKDTRQRTEPQVRLFSCFFLSLYLLMITYRYTTRTGPATRTRDSGRVKTHLEAPSLLPSLLTKKRDSGHVKTCLEVLSFPSNEDKRLKTCQYASHACFLKKNIYLFFFPTYNYLLQIMNTEHNRGSRRGWAPILTEKPPIYTLITSAH